MAPQPPGHLRRLITNYAQLGGGAADCASTERSVCGTGGNGPATLGDGNTVKETTDGRWEMTGTMTWIVLVTSLPAAVLLLYAAIQTLLTRQARMNLGDQCDLTPGGLWQGRQHGKHRSLLRMRWILVTDRGGMRLRILWRRAAAADPGDRMRPSA